MPDILAEALQGFVPTGHLALDVPALLLRHGRDGVAAHVQQVVANAQGLAARVGVNKKAACDAAWLHDIGRVIPSGAMLDAALTAGLDVLPEERQAPGILHGKLSVQIAERFFGITDPVVLDAIRCHSTLRAGATPLDKLLLVSDKLAWDPADAPFHDDLVAALDRSLDDAVRCFLNWTWQQRDRMAVMHPWLRQACLEVATSPSTGRTAEVRVSPQ